MDREAQVTVCGVLKVSDMDLATKDHQQRASQCISWGQMGRGRQFSP